MLLHSCSQLLTLAGKPQRGAQLGRLGIIPDGAVLMHGGAIRAVGTTAELRAAYPYEAELDANGMCVMPGFVDPHTHLVWAGDRAAEFEMRLQGKTYMEILAAGGGILSTVVETRLASPAELLAQTRERAQEMFRYGTTTAEAKTGYGLNTESELRQLKVLLDLDDEGPLEILPTHLGAHAVAPEYQGYPELYTDVICREMLPETRSWWRTYAGGRPLPFVDVFCERAAFDLEQSRKVLEMAFRLGFPLKIHADEFDNLGGASLAAELGAVSADHLVKTSKRDIANLASSDTVAVALPCTPFGLGDPNFTPALDILKADGLLALASDLNPGTAWCGNMQFVIALACRYLKLTPAQAIAASTINAAAAVGCAERLGSLEVGKQADLIILNVPDYRHLGYRFGANMVRTVVKRGEVYPN